MTEEPHPVPFCWDNDFNECGCWNDGIGACMHKDNYMGYCGESDCPKAELRTKEREQ